MATVTFQEWGTDPSGAFTPYGSTSGDFSSSTSVYNNGKRSAKLFTSSPASAAQIAAFSVLADAGRRITFQFRTDTTPAGQAVFHSVLSGAALGICNVLLNTDRTITLAPVGATSTTGSKVLAVDTWYRITLSYTITNTTTFRFDLWINGVLETSATAGTLTRTGSAILQFLVSPTAGANVSNYFDDVYVDNGSDYGDPGDMFSPLPNNTQQYVKVGSGMSRNERAS